MKKGLFLLIIVLMAVLAGIGVAKDPGYALFLYQGYSVEMPLWFFVLFILIVFSLFYVFIRIVNGARVWNRQRKRNYTHKMLCRGLIEFTEGHWAAAETYLTKKVKRSDAPLVHYLLAAQAAHAQKDYEKRDAYLRLAYESDSSASIAIGLTQARLQLDQQQLEQALASLRHLRQLSPYHEGVLEALSQVYLALKDWTSLQELLPMMSVSKEQRRILECAVYVGLLSSRDDWEEVWQESPHHVRHYTEVLFVYLEKLIAAQHHEKAERLLREQVQHQWDNRLVSLYANIDAHQDKQLKIAEQWYKLRPDSAELLMVLAVLSERQQLWGNAKMYYEASLRAAPKRTSYLKYIEFLLSQQDKTAALAKSLEALQDH